MAVWVILKTGTKFRTVTYFAFVTLNAVKGLCRAAEILPLSACRRQAGGRQASAFGLRMTGFSAPQVFV